MKGKRQKPGKPATNPREEIMRTRIVEALNWLDVQAPGRAHNALTEALRTPEQLKDWEDAAKQYQPAV